MKIETNISWGYIDLIRIFGEANNINWILEKRTTDHITINCDNNFGDMSTLTFMSIKHSGIENMLCDYLMKCGVHPAQISTGRFLIRKTPEELEEDWQAHRKKLGFR